MGLTDSIRAGVEAAKAAVADLLVDVKHFPAIGRDENGIVYPAQPIIRQAFVEDGQTEAVGAGMVATSIGKLTFFESIPITPDDRFEVPPSAAIPYGIQGEVLRMASPLGGDGKPLISEVWLG